MFSIFFGLSRLLEQVKRQGVVRPDTRVQFQKHACVRIPLVVFFPDGCHFEHIHFHVEWCACGAWRFKSVPEPHVSTCPEE